jgi:hypothetical protein
VEWFFTALLVIGELLVTGYFVLCAYRLYSRQR